MLTRTPLPGLPLCTVAHRLRFGPNWSCRPVAVGGGEAVLEAEDEDELGGGFEPPANQTDSQLVSHSVH
jgi:hypothetical protein